MNKFNALAVAVLMAGVSTHAMAAEDSGVYLRGEVGNATLHVDGESGTDTAMSGWLGYNFNKTFAVEVHAGSLGKDSGDGLDIEAKAVGAGLRLRHRFDGSDAYIAGRIGMERVSSEVRYNGWYFEEEANRAYFGIGAGYNFTPKFAVTAYFDTRQVPFVWDDERVDTLTIGAEISF